MLMLKQHDESILVSRLGLNGITTAQNEARGVDEIDPKIRAQIVHALTATQTVNCVPTSELSETDEPIVEAGHFPRAILLVFIVVLLCA